MARQNPLLHRTIRLAAKSYRLGRHIVSQFTTPSPVENLMDSLPAVVSTTELKGKVVVITGATRGVGFAVAEAFAKAGARVVINGRREEAVASAVEKLGKEGAEVSGVVADVATPEGAQRLILESAAANGAAIDVLINNAAVGGPVVPTWELDPPELMRTIQDNLIGPLLCSREALRHFREKGRHGRIINVSSLATEHAIPQFLVYTTTKAALETATKLMAADLPDASVVVTGIILHSVQTEAKFALDWSGTALLPPVESVVPAFKHAATGSADLLHGRVFSSARFNAEPEAEAQLAGVASIRRRILYDEVKVDDETIVRDPAAFGLLDRVENQYGPSPKAMEAIRTSLAVHSPAYYPDERFKALTRALADEHGLEPENFALGAGSWELISRMVNLFAKPGEEVVSNSPGWFGFNLVCQRQSVLQKKVPFDTGENGNRPSHNLAGIRKEITPRTRLVYLISPSNPEGVPLQHNEVKEFLKDLPPQLPVMVDEAYTEYNSSSGSVDIAALVREGVRSVIGLRTFSKFYGLAGMRVGYAYANAGMAEFIRRQEQIFQISHVAEVAAVASLADKEHRRSVFQQSLVARGAMHRALAGLAVQHIPSEATYILIDTPRHFDAMTDNLARRGLIVPRYRFYGDKRVMLPIGTQAQVDQVLDALRQGM